MKLPNGAKAEVDIVKLRDYCLSMSHARGRHKARVFHRALGITDKDSERLQSELLRAAAQEDADPAENDEFGQRYTIDLTVQGPSGEARIRSLWIVRTSENYPRLITCYVL